MVQQVHLVCNACHADDGQTVPATTSRTIIIGGRAPRTLDLCDLHDKTMIAPIIALLETAPTGRITAGALSTRPSVVRQTEMWHCPVCEEDIRRGGAVLHLWRHTPDGRPPAQPEQCPECDSKHKDPRGMARHRQNTHGWDGFAEAIAAALAAQKPTHNIGPSSKARVKQASQSAKRRREEKAAAR